MPALSLALLPDAIHSRKLREMAEGQRDVARVRAGKRSGLSYSEGARTYDWQAEQVLRVSREMPTTVLALDATHVAVAFRNGQKDARFRIVNVHTAEIVFEISGAEVDALCGPPSRYRRSDEEIALLDEVRSQLDESIARFLPPNEGTIPSRSLLLAAENDLLLFSLGQKGTWLFRLGSSALVPIRSLGLFADGWGCAAIVDGTVLICGSAAIGRDQSLFLVDPVKDRVLARYELGRSSAVAVAVTKNRHIGWVALFGNAVIRVDFSTITFSRQKLWRGLSRKDHYTIAADDVGDSLLLSVTQGDARRVALVDLISEQAILMRARDEEAASFGPAGFPTLRRVPGYCFIDGKPYALRAGRLETLEAVEGTAANPIPAVAVPLRLRVKAEGRISLSSVGQLARVYHPGLNLTAHRVSDTMPIASTKFGGLPDLLTQLGSWPTFSGKPMYFVAQFNLGELSPHCPEWRLPKSGLLSFFRAFDESGDWPMWYDPESRANASVVLYSPDVDDLVSAARPRGLRSVGRECRLSHREAFALPPMDAWRWRATDLPIEDREAVELLGLTFREVGPERSHQLGGYPAYPMDELALPAELMSQGREQFLAFDGNSPEGKQLIGATAEWVPLAAFNSCEIADITWGDGGVLAYMIRSVDLDARRFDRAIAVSGR
jgi:uncharacterized protein YwqG